MAQRNVGKEIAWILAATALLGGGMFVYLKSSNSTAEDHQANTQMTSASASASSATAPGTSLNERATAVTQRFIDALREKRFADAYALTVRTYQNATRPMEFEAAITGSPYMLSPRTISFVRITQQSVKRDDGKFDLGPVLARGMLVSDHGNVDVSVTLSHEEDTLHILTIIGAGAPLFNGIVPTQ